jgi:ATP-dependent Clp protease ATP-binding subunit ClpA
LPDKAIDVIDEACSRVVLKSIEPRQVDENIVKDIISSLSGIPISRLSENESEILLGLEDLIHKRMVDQEPAVTAVSEAIRRNRAGLKNPKRPIGSFIFLGPTGVGKTQLAKTLAEVMFGSEEKMIRIDMSEYMEKNSTARMIGAPPGYVGYEEGGQLTEAVRKNPYSVILFDEIEKANSEVFNIFLQILDDGRLTDNKGRTIDFKNSIIICTSNIGTHLIKGQNVEEPTLKKMIMYELLRFFRPEFINRFDDITVFRGLMPKDMEAIVSVMIDDVTKLISEQKIALSITDAAKTRMAQLGFDPVYGARPLRRMIQKMIENPLSNAIIKGEITQGETILIDTDPTGKFTFKSSGKAPSQGNEPS